MYVFVLFCQLTCHFHELDQITRRNVAQEGRATEVESPKRFCDRGGLKQVFPSVVQTLVPLAKGILRKQWQNTIAMILVNPGQYLAFLGCAFSGVRVLLAAQAPTPEKYPVQPWRRPVVPQLLLNLSP